MNPYCKAILAGFLVFLAVQIFLSFTHALERHDRRQAAKRRITK